MNEELEKKFAELKANGETALVAFMTIGYPTLSATQKLAKALEAADIIEVGIPFSDPIADGPVIQQASQKALENGANPAKCFSIIQEIKTNKPIVILTYYNLIYKMGVLNFVRKAKQSGVNAILAADLPIEEAEEFEKACEDQKVGTVFIIAPNTPKERIREIATHTTGFIYLMAHYGVTGAKQELGKETIETLKRIKEATNIPVCVGFGISKKEHVAALKKAGADGAIVGSALIKTIEGKKMDAAERAVKKLATELKRGTL